MVAFVLICDENVSEKALTQISERSFGDFLWSFTPYLSMFHIPIFLRVKVITPVRGFPKDHRKVMEGNGGGIR